MRKNLTRWIEHLTSQEVVGGGGGAFVGYFCEKLPPL